MSFFDLNIPYMEKSGLSTVDSGKHRDSRLKTVARAMEFGYTAVAYNHPFRGVLSDADRCKIAPFSSESFLNFVTEGSQVAFTASVALHRGLLGVPRASPFRQYTRITVFVDSVASASAINSGKRLLRSYDLVATRPLNQMAFDQACKVSEVDIISLDFSQKLPFRLKLAMVQAAVKRGVYFEISYSHFIAGGHARLQILSEAKRLTEWTRGKNLIISGSAPSLNEVRGPLDVANLSTVLLGLTMERAKLAISGNARTLVADALRKRDYYFKEAIRIERISPAEKLDSQEDWFNDWNDWDPISSGANDLPSLDDMAKLFSAASKHSKSQNSINFSSSIIGMAPNATTLFPCVNKHKLNADISLMKDAVATVSKYVSNTVTEDDMNPCLGESGIHIDAIETSLWAEMPISNDSLLSLNASTSSFVNSKDQISMISKDSISTVEEYEGMISSAGEILGYPDKSVSHEKGFSDMNEDHCILREIKVEGKSIESRHATRCGVANNNLHKSKKQRKRPHHQGYLLRAKNLCKPLLFKKATRLRRIGKFLQS